MDSYVYMCLDSLKPGSFVYDKLEFNYEPFYVGKGQGNRFKEIVESRRGLYFNNKARKIERESEVGVISLKIFKGTEADCFEFEKVIIRLVGRKDLGLGPLINFTDGGEGTAGLVFSKKHKERLSRSKKGSKNPMFGGCFTFKHRKKMSEAQSGSNNGFYGKVHTEETKRKMSKAWKKRGPVSDETRKKLSKAHKGRTMSDETKKKLSDANKGQIPWTKGRKLSKEHREKLSIAAKKRPPLSVETRKKMLATRALRGYSVSEATRKKISETMKKLRRREREERVEKRCCQ